MGLEILGERPKAGIEQHLFHLVRHGGIPTCLQQITATPDEVRGIARLMHLVAPLPGEPLMRAAEPIGQLVVHL